MKRAPHSTAHPASCPACLTHAATTNLLDRPVLDHMAMRLPDYEKRHAAVIKKQEGE